MNIVQKNNFLRPILLSCYPVYVGGKNNHGSKMISALLFICMLLTPMVFAMDANTSQMIYTKDSWRPESYSRLGLESEEAKTFGTCEKLSDNSILCCNIKENYTVECCLHPASVISEGCVGQSRCVSFDPGGIIGDQLGSPHINLLTLLYNLLENASNQHVSNIADEYETALKANVYRIDRQKHSDGSNFRCFADDEKCKYFLQVSNIYDLSEIVPLVPIREHRFPTLICMIEKLHRKFNLPSGKGQPVSIMLDSFLGLGFRYPSAFVYTGFDDKASRLVLTGKFLQQKWSDDVYAAVSAHELFHMKQKEDRQCSFTRNNEEVEADLSSILATNSTNLGVFLANKLKANNELLLPTITRENVHEVLSEQDEMGHPLPATRIAFILTMNEHFQKAKALLLES